MITNNNGSTDNTLNILNEYGSKDNRITVISQKNLGHGSARNKGLDKATGDYVYFIDSDDYIDLNALSILHKIATENNTDLIMFRSQNFNDDPNEPFEEKYNPWIRKIKNVGYYNDVKEKLFLKNFTKISYRFINIDDGYKEYFFDCLKTDLKNNEDEIKNNIDFSLIDERTRFRGLNFLVLR